MAIAADSARNRARPATLPATPSATTAATTRRGVIDLRRGGRALAGSHSYLGQRLVTGWHSHDVHQIEYAVTGVVEVETADAHYLLPPLQAMWIPAGLEHQATMNSGARTISAMFAPELLPGAVDRARVLAASPLIRELILHSVRWPIERDAGDEVSDTFFRAFGHVVLEALDHEAPLSLPNSSNPIVAAATAHTREHLDTVTAAEVARAVAVSERTLRREFRTALGLSWRTYLQQARLLRAVALLAAPGTSVRDVATAVGFDSVSSFTRAFTTLVGETPTTYRTRVTRDAGARPPAP